MRLTRLGLVYLSAAGLTFFAAASSGNNLLYLFFGVQLSALAVCAAWSRLNLAWLQAELGLPERVFHGRAFGLTVSLSKSGRLPSYQLRLRSGELVWDCGRLGRESRRWSLPHSFPYRGRNRISGLWLESSFPLGLFRLRRELAGEALALPAPRPGRYAPEESESGRGGLSRPRKGVGEELYGIREYNESDDLRQINWKVTARTGRPMVNEYAERYGSRLVVRVGPGEGGIERAASEFKYLIESGAEVNLVTPEGETGFGKGLLHLDRGLRLLALLGEGKTLRGGAAAAPAAAPAFQAAPHALLLFQATVLLVYLSLFLVDDLSPGWLSLLALVFPLAWWLDRHEDWRPRPSWWTLPSACMLVYGVFFGWRRFGVSVSTVQILLYILAHRLLSPKGPRELAQAFAVGFLGFFLACGLSSSMWFPVFFLAYLASACAWLLASHDGAARPAWGPALGVLLALVLPLGAAAFVLTPRFEARRFGSPLAAAGLDKLNLTPSAMVGFTEEVSLGFFGELKKGSARAMRVRPEGGVNQGALRLRGAALDAFDGMRWSKTRRDFSFRFGKGEPRPSEDGRAWLLRRRGRLALPAAAEASSAKGGGSPAVPALAGAMEPPAKRFEFFLYPLPTATAFTVGDPEAVETDEGSAYFDYTASLYFPGPATEGRRYAVLARRGENRLGEAVVDEERFLRGSYLAVPRPAPRLEKLARTLTRRAKTPLEAVRAVESHLRDKYDYSLFMAAPQTLEGFLFDTRQGNCEYFATAGAVLLREAGIPTRLVTGFLATEWNPYGRYYDVRQSDAHAWLEAYVSGRGWITVDPTARERGLALPGLAGLKRRLDRFADAWRLSWYRDVVGFDPMGQRELWQKLEAALGALGLAALGAAALGALVWLGLALRRGLRAFKPRTRPGGQFYHHMLGALERSGLVREGWQTGREFAGAVALRRPGLAAPVAALTDYHYRLSYGAAELGAEDRGRIDKLLRELRAAL